MLGKSLNHIKDIHSVSIVEAKLLYKLAKQSKGNIVEIGSWKGYSTIWLAKGSLSGNKNSVYAIDPHTGSAIHHKMYGKIDTFNEFMKNINDSGVDNIVIPMRMTSEEASKNWNEYISLLWIDGDHTLAEKDFKMWVCHLGNGGIIALHDTTTWDIPRKVAIEYIYKSRWFKDIHRLGSITYATKTSTANDNTAALYARYIYQGLLPYYNIILKIGGNILGRN